MQTPIESNNGTIWTLCPYCYYLYEYNAVYKGYCLRCQNCDKPFHAVAVPEPPPGILVEGKDQYYCTVGYFPLKFNFGSNLGDKKEEDLGFRVTCNNNEGFSSKLENPFVISDDSEDDCEIGGKEEIKIERDCNVDKTGPLLEIKGKVHYKRTAKNTKKKMGRGIRCDLIENTGAEFEKEDEDCKLEKDEENTGSNGSEEEGFYEDDLEFLLRENDVYVGLEGIL